MPVGASLDTKGREKKESAGSFRGEGKSFLLAVKTPEERVGAVEYLKRALHGSSARLQRSARVIQRSPSAPRSKERSNELVLNKQASGRKKDQTDLEALGVE